MKLPSTLISRLASTTLEGAELQSGELELIIPAVVQPIIELPLPVRKFTGFSATTNNSDSFMNNILQGQPASTAQKTTNVGQFKRGLWRLRFTVSMLATFTQTSDGTVNAFCQIGLVDDAGVNLNLVSLFAVNAVPQNIFIDTGEIEFPADGWFLQSVLLATGVGQTLVSEVNLYAARLH